MIRALALLIILACSPAMAADYNGGFDNPSPTIVIQQPPPPDAPVVLEYPPERIKRGCVTEHVTEHDDILDTNDSYTSQVCD